MRFAIHLLATLFLFPLTAYSFESAIEDNDRLFFEYNSRAYMYDLKTHSVQLELDASIPSAIINDGVLYAQVGSSGLEIFTYTPPAYLKSLFFSHEEIIVGFGFIEDTLIVGLRNGHILGYKRDSLEALFNHSLESYISDLVVSDAGDIYVVDNLPTENVLKKFAIDSGTSGLDLRAQTRIPDNYIALEADDAVIKTFSGLMFHSADLSYLASAAGGINGTGNILLAASQCGYMQHDLNEGPTKTFTTHASDDYFFIEGDELVEISFRNAIEDPAYVPMRKSLGSLVYDEPLRLDQAVALQDFIFPNVSSDEREYFYLSGREGWGAPTVSVWSVAEESAVVSFSFSCGVRNTVYSSDQEKYFVYDHWGRVYVIDMKSEEIIRHLTSAGRDYHSIAATADGLEIVRNGWALLFDFSGNFRSVGSATTPSLDEVCNVPSFNRADCHRYPDIQHIPNDQRSVVAWVGDQLVTLSEDYRLRFWDETGSVTGTYAAPYHHILTMEDKLVLLRFEENSTAFLAVDPANLPDTDADGVNDLADNCISQQNQSQADLDQDGIGDICDPDVDGDFLPNIVEVAAGLDEFNKSDADGDRDADGFTNLVEYALASEINSAASVPVAESAYSETFENGWPRRFFSGGKQPWSLSSLKEPGFVLRSANESMSAEESSVFFYFYSDRSLAVSFYAQSMPDVKINGFRAIDVHRSSTLDNGWIMVTVGIGSGVNKVEIVNEGSPLPPIIGAAFYQFIDEISVGIDRDFDGISDSLDLCPLTPKDISANGVNHDGDGDGMAHLCDSDDNRFDVLVDSDGDGYFTHADNCPDVHNVSQLDSDSDFIGDFCDTDDDNDGFSDELELLHGSSTTIVEYEFAIGTYFPTKLGKFTYKDSQGNIVTQEISRPANGQYRTVDNEGFFAQYNVGGEGLYFTAFGDQEGSLDLGMLKYLPNVWRLDLPQAYSSEATAVPLTHQAQLLDFHIVEFNGQQYSAATFRVTQMFDGETVSTDETYIKGVGLYKFDDFELIEIEQSEVVVAQPQKKKKKGGSSGVEMLLMLIALLVARSPIKRPKVSLEGKWDFDTGDPNNTKPFNGIAKRIVSIC
jgi:hypothetical protein